MRLVLYSVAETKKFARKVARTLKPRRHAATTLALAGELGSGKTTFVQGLARSLGVREKILSPTFVLMRQHKVVALTTERKRRRMQPFSITHERTNGSTRLTAGARTHRRHNRLWHVDCYRLERPEELVRLGFKEILKDPKNIVVVEWADKVRRLLPKDAMWIQLEHGKREKERVITLKAKGKTKKSKRKGKRQKRTGL